MARYYDPSQGRFLSLDPLFLESDSTNFYAYCNGDPINYIDPSGELIFCTILIGAAIGAAIGAGIEALRQKRTGEDMDGFQIAKAAFIGGAIGAIGVGVGTAIEAAAAAGTLGTAMAASTLPALAGVGFLSGAGSSVAEQCAEARMTGKAVDPLSMTTQALTDGVIGGGVSLVTLGAGGFLARRLRKAPTLFRPAQQMDEVGSAAHRQSKKLKAQATSAAQNKSRQFKPRDDISSVGEPVNAVTGEVILTQTDFALPGRIPLTWTRNYRSGDAGDGLLGRGWQTPADARLEIDPKGLITFYDGSPGGAVFNHLPAEEPVMEASDGAMLSATDDEYRVRLKSGLTYHFAKELELGPAPVIAISDPSGNERSFIRDAKGILTRICDSSGQCIDVTSSRGRIQSMRIGKRLLISYQYEDRQLIAAIDAMGRPKRFTYEDRRLVRHTDTNRLSFYYEYDDSGLVATVIDHGSRPTRYQRDLLGNITAVIDADGKATRYVYDDVSRLIQSAPPTGLSQHFEWDGGGNLLLHTDAAGQQTRFEYTGVNEIARRINADGTSVSSTYDNQENLIGVTNEKGDTHHFEYDPAGRVIAQTDYYGHTTRYLYDKAGQMIRSVDPLDRMVNYGYDAAGRLITKTFENDEQEFFHWYANGNLTGVQSPGAVVERFYDAANRLIAEKSGAFIVEYQYDQTGRRTRRTTSHGNTVHYEYDAVGAVCAIRINDQAPVTIQRDRLGRITAEQLSDHLEREFGYNEAGLLSRQTITGAAGRTERLYDYDPAGNLTARHDSHKGPWQFTHDPMGRITEALDPERRVHRYGYDPAGDLLDHLPDTGHSLRSARHNQTEYRFDTAGNLAERRNGDGLTKFAWDEQNRLINARTPDDHRIDMTYDALGRRHIKAVNGERTFFNWDGDALLSEQFEDGAPREYVYYPGTFEPLALIDGDGQVYYYHNDLNGLPQELTKPNGDIVWSAAYDALGRLDQILVNEVVQPLRFQGQYFDPETDLCYNRHRYYDPQICSFISQDPLGLAAGENIYAYAPNVWGWVDPLGLACENTASNLPIKHPFSDGGTHITTTGALERYKSLGSKTYGSPDNGLFVAPKSDVDALLKRANNRTEVEVALGLKPGQLSTGNIVRVDVDNPLSKNLIPPTSGNEYFREGVGLTSGGLREGVIDAQRIGTKGVRKSIVRGL